jgi:cytochrome b
MLRRIFVWDAPTRVFHWLQVLSFAFAYYTADSERLRNYHVALGYILLGLLVFRMAWGFWGTRYARFASFLYPPKEVIAYLSSMLRRKPDHFVGHNPAGGIAIMLLLLLGLATCITGVLSLQDDASDFVVNLHDLATDAMLVVIFLHLVGVSVNSLLNRENLVLSMFTGYKKDAGAEEAKPAYNWLAAAMVLAVVAFWFVYVKKPLGR